MRRFLLSVGLLLAVLAGQARASDLFTVGRPEWLAGGGIGDGGPALAASLLPWDVAADGDGVLYVADEQHNLVRAVGEDGLIRTAVGSGGFGFNGDGLLAREANLQVPVNLTVGPDGRLYLVDLGNRQVRVVAPDGSLRTLLSEAHPGLAGLTQPFAPAGLALGADGTVYVADRGNQSVWKVDGDGRVERVTGTGEWGFDGDAQRPAKGARLGDPHAVAAGPDGSLYIADTGNRRVRRVGPDGAIETWAGAGSQVDWDGWILAWHASFEPVDLAVDGEGRLLIADRLVPRLLRMESSRVVETVATFPEGTELRGVGVDNRGDYLVAGGRYVWRVPAEGGAPEIAAGNGAIRGSGDGGDGLNASLYGPLSLAYDRAGNLYVADRGNHLVRRVRADGIIERVAGTGEPGFGGDGGMAVAASLQYPAGLAFDAEGVLYIADERNHRVRRVRADGIIETVAGTGEPGFDGDGGMAVAARLQNPTGLAFDQAGNLYIADAGNARVRRIGVDGRIATVAGGGRSTPEEGLGPALELALVLPVDVQVDERGRLVIADAGGHRVYRLGQDGWLRGIAGTGEAGRGWDGARADRADLAWPTGVLADGVGGVFIADSDNGRLVHVDAEGVLRIVNEDFGRPVRMAWTEGGMVVADAARGRVGRLMVERRWAPLEERIRLSGGYEIEEVAGMPVEGLLEVVRDSRDGRVYVTRNGWVERIGAGGARLPYAEIVSRDFRTLAAVEGMYVGRPSYTNDRLPLALIREQENGKPLLKRVELTLDGVDALGWSDGLLIHQVGGRLLRLVEGEAREFARLPVGPALVQGGPDGVVYVALQETKTLLRLADLDGDGRADGPGELQNALLLPSAPVAMTYSEGLCVATATRIYRVTEGFGLEELAQGFAPGLLDIESAGDGGLYALEGDSQGGRLLRLGPSTPRIAVWPGRLDFGALPLGAAAIQTLVLRNDGSAPVALELVENGSGVLVGGALTLTPGEERRVEVQLTPRQAGRVEELWVWQGENGEILLRTPVAVEGLVSRLVVKSATVDFGTVQVGESAARRVEVYNAGEADLVVDRVDVDRPFGLDFSGPEVVAPGASLVIGLGLAPGARQAYSGTLRIYSNDPEQPVRQLPLSGQGGQAELQGVPEEIELGTVLVGQGNRQAVELRNTGELELRVEQVLTGQAQVLVSPRAAIVPPGGKRSLSVFFQPKENGPVQGELTFVTNDPAWKEARIPFAGQGLSAWLQASEGEHVFPAVQLGERLSWDLVLTNFSRETATVTAATSNSGQFRVVAIPEPIPAGGQGIVRVEYRPTWLGETQGVLTVRTDLAGAPRVEVQLSGRGQVATRLTLEPVSGVRPGEETTVPVRVDDAVQLSGLGLELALAEGVEWLGMAFPEGSLLYDAEVLVVQSRGEDGRLAVGLSLTGERQDEGITGSGLLGLLRLRTQRGGRVAIERATFRASSGAVDALDLETTIELRLSGDLDGDGRVTVADFFTLVDGLGEPPEGVLAGGDLDGDGRIDRRDVEIMLGLLEPGPAAKLAEQWAMGPLEAELLPAFPNPFNATVTIRYVLPGAREVKLAVYNALGQVVRQLADGVRAAGMQEVTWDGLDAEGRAVGTGLYLAVLESGGARRLQRLLLVR